MKNNLSQLRFLLFYLLICIDMTSVAQDESNKQTKMSPSKIEMTTFLALGDSYTIGESVSIESRWPNLLARELVSYDIDLKEVNIVAKTGWTTDELMSHLKKTNISSNYDLVGLCIGVNNQYRGRSTEEFRAQFSEVLDMAISYANNNVDNVFVLSIPDWSVVPFAEGRDLEKIKEEIRAFNKIKKEVTQEKNCTFIDITKISRKAKYKKKYVAKDGLHFSGSMHELWVAEIIKKMNFGLSN